MKIDFSNQDLIAISGTFRIKLEKWKRFRDTPGCPVDAHSINQQIKLYESIISKINEASPGLAAMDEHTERLCQDPDFLSRVD